MAFEPLPEFARSLMREFPAVEVHECALSDVTGAAEFVHVVDRPAISTLVDRDAPHGERRQLIRVRLATLDEILPADFVPAFIKIDVEGSEGRVFRGAAETIRRHAPIVVFEHDKRWAETPSDDLYNLLAGLGMRIFDLDGIGPMSRVAFTSVVSAGRKWNFMARP